MQKTLEIKGLIYSGRDCADAKAARNPDLRLWAGRSPETENYPGADKSKDKDHERYRNCKNEKPHEVFHDPGHVNRNLPSARSAALPVAINLPPFHDVRAAQKR